MNPAPAERKVIIAGHVGSGKTTALQSIFGENMLSTDARYSDALPTDKKKTTTVAMDYGVVTCPMTDYRLHLYAIPGQERFQFMWEILGKNTDGLVVLVDAKRPNPIAAIHLYLDKILPFLNRAVVVVALNKLSLEERETLKMPPYLRHGELRLRLTTTDAQNQDEVFTLLRLLIDEMALVDAS
jgi:signal recognition particle receptor subunit beta